MTYNIMYKLESAKLKTSHRWKILTLHVLGILILSACTFGDALPANTVEPLPIIPTGQAIGIIPATAPTLGTAEAESSYQDEIDEIFIYWFYFEPKNIQAGECTKLIWEVINIPDGMDVSIYIDGELVAPKGERAHCTCKSETHYLWVMARNRTIIASKPASLDIYEGSTCAPSIDTPLSPSSQHDFIDPTPDNFGPFIFGEDAWFPYDTSCLVVGTASFHDPAGVAQAKFGYNLNKQGWQWLWMSKTSTQPDGLEDWRSDEGFSITNDINTPVGHFDFQFWAVDTLGNETYSEVGGKDFNGCSVTYTE